MKIQIRSQKEVVQQYFQLRSNFNLIMKYTLSCRFSGSDLIPIGGMPQFPIWSFKMDVTYSMISVNIGGIRENIRRGVVINYCKTLDTDFFIF